MGGGGGGDTVTNVTNTGLGDDQYQTLYDNQGTIKENQANIAGSIDQAKSDASTAYDTIYGRFNTTDSNLADILSGQTDISDLIGKAGRYSTTGRTDPTGLYAQFANTNKNLTDSFGNVTTQFDDLTRDIGTQSTNIKSNIGSRIDTLDDDMGGRFDDVDKGITGVSGQVTDVQSTADTIDDNTKGLGGSLDDLADANKNRFDNVDDTLDDGFDDAQKSRKDIYDDSQGSRDNIIDDLDTMAGNQADYYGDLAGTLGEVQEGQDGFVSSFDDYIDRYDDDQDTAREQRSNILTGQETAYENLRDDIGEYSQDVSGYASDTDSAIDTGFTGLGDTVEGGFKEVDDSFTGLDDTVEGGFKETQDDIEAVGDSITGDFSAFEDTVTDSFDTELANMYDSLSEDLASQGVDINDVLLDAFDAQNQTLDVNAKSLLDLGSQITGLDENMAASFDTVASAFDDQGNLIGQTVDEMGNVVTNQISDQGTLISNKFDTQGKLIGTTETNITDTLNAANEAQTNLQNQIAGTLGGAIDANAQALATGFDAQNATLSDQGKQLLTMGLNMDGLSDQQKAQMQEISGAFDAQGNLIRTGQDAMGNTIQREMDANGNMIQKKFDQQGNLIGETSLNVSDVMQGVNKLNTISGQIEQGFGGVQQELSDQQGLMTEMNNQQVSQLEDTQNQIISGFDSTAGMMDTQVRDLAGVASQMTDLDMGMRQQFYQMGGAFSDTGELIQESVDQNGNTIRRSIDESGNLLLRAFDDTGTTIGQNVININKALGDLANIETMPGANLSMGNLSPAMQANPRQGEPNVPTSGFMSPFTTTV